MQKHVLNFLKLLPLIALLFFWPSSPRKWNPFIWRSADTLEAQTVTHGVTLTWNATTTTCAAGTTPCVIAYNVYRGTVTGGPYSQIASGVSALTYKDTTGTAGTAYFYVVTATVTGYTESAYSNQASATFLAPAAAPGSLAATSN